MPFTPRLDGTLIYFWKDNKPFNWKKPMFTNPKIQYEIFSNAYARSMCRELTNDSFAYGQKKVKAEWMRRRNDSLYVKSLIEKYAWSKQLEEDHCKAPTKSGWSLASTKPAPSDPVKTVLTKSYSSALKGEVDDDAKLSPAVSYNNDGPDTVVLQFCNVTGITAPEASLKTLFWSNTKAGIILSQLEDVLEAAIEYNKVKTELNSVSVRIKEGSALRMATRKVDDEFLKSLPTKLEGLFCELSTKFRTFRNHMSMAKNNAANTMTAAMATSQEVHDVVQKISTVVLELHNMTTHVLLKPTSGLIVSMRKQIHNRREVVKQQRMCWMSNPIGDEAPLLAPERKYETICNAQALRYSWAPTFQKLNELPADSFNCFDSAEEVIQIGDMIKHFGGLDISDAAGNMPKKEFQEMAREICSVLPVICIHCPASRGAVLIDPNVDGIFLTGLIEKALGCASVKEQPQDENQDGVSSTSDKDDGEIKVVVQEVYDDIVNLLEQDDGPLAEMKGDFLDDAFMNVHLADVVEDQLEEKDEYEGLGYQQLKPGPVPIHISHPEIITHTLEFLEANGLAASNKRRDDTMLHQGTPVPALHAYLKLHIPGLKISERSLNYLFKPPNKAMRSAKNYHGVIDSRPAVKRNSARKENEDAHYCAALVKFVRDVASEFRDSVDLWSVDDKAKINCNGKVAVSRYHHLREYYVTGMSPNFNDHDFPARGYLIIPSGYWHISFDDAVDPETKKITTIKSGKLYLSLRAMPFESSTAQSHLNDMLPLLKKSDKPLVFIISDNGPDWSTGSKKVILSLGRLWRDSGKDGLILVMYAANQSAYNDIERVWAFLSRKLAGLVLKHTYDGEKVPPSLQKKLSEKERREKEKEIFDSAMDIVRRHWHGKNYKGVPIDCSYVPCGAEPAPFNDAAIVEETLKLAPTKVYLDKDGKLAKEVKEVVDEFKFMIAHLDRRKHFLLFAKCKHPSCSHCVANPISKESEEILYNTLLKHDNTFYAPTKDKSREGDHYITWQ